LLRKVQVGLFQQRRIGGLTAALEERFSLVPSHDKPTTSAACICRPISTTIDG